MRSRYVGKNLKLAHPSRLESLRLQLQAAMHSVSPSEHVCRQCLGVSDDATAAECFLAFDALTGQLAACQPVDHAMMKAVHMAWETLTVIHGGVSPTGDWLI